MRPTSDGQGAGGSGLTGVAAVDAVLEEAIGRHRRHDPVVGRTGGPAGNARLTSWVGLVLLVLIVAELITLLNVTGLIGWHVGVGIALVAFTLVKVASTGWRAARYYRGSPVYRTAGPPPTLLRLLGPGVVVSTLGVLGSGLALVAIGPGASRRSLFAVFGQQVTPITIHQVLFILFAVLAGVHLLGRLVPAVAQASGRHGGHPESTVPGWQARGAVLLAAAGATGLAVALVLPVHGW